MKALPVHRQRNHCLLTLLYNCRHATCGFL